MLNYFKYMIYKTNCFKNAYMVKELTQPEDAPSVINN